MIMFEYISAHPLVGLALVLLIILTVFVWFKAIQSGKKRSAERERIIADLEKEKALRNEFRHVDETTFAEGKDDYRLVTGMCANVQMSIEKKTDMTAAFNELSEVKRFIYALGYIFEDGKVSLSNFFRSNGEPLLSTANEAVKSIIGGEYAELFTKAFSMFDENNEEVSVIESEVEKFDSEYKSMFEKDGKEIYKKAADYVRENKTEFI